MNNTAPEYLITRTGGEMLCPGQLKPEFDHLADWLGPLDAPNFLAMSGTVRISDHPISNARLRPGLFGY